MLAAVAAGAFVAAGTTLNTAQSADKLSDGITPLASGADAQAVLGMGGGTTADDLLRPQLLSLSKAPSSQLEGLNKGIERAAREAEARRPLFVIPTTGVLTSGYGYRWGVMHYGIDIANQMGTPIYAAADGVVVEAGPASGFGMWVRIKHADGTTTIYGHIDRALVSAGQRVKAGQQIATMGNRGHSTGPHLHFEVWNASGAKINPLTWLRSKGLQI